MFTAGALSNVAALVKEQNERASFLETAWAYFIKAQTAMYFSVPSIVPSFSYYSTGSNIMILKAELLSESKKPQEALRIYESLFDFAGPAMSSEQLRVKLADRVALAYAKAADIYNEGNETELSIKMLEHSADIFEHLGRQTGLAKYPRLVSAIKREIERVKGLN